MDDLNEMDVTFMIAKISRLAPPAALLEERC
jgi:hypothetical protein